MANLQLPDEISARLNRPMPWWKLLDCPDLSGSSVITREASSFAQKLSKFRVAVVPDPRIDAGGITGDTPCMAFRIGSCNRHVLPDYEAAKLQLKRDLAFLMVKGRPSPRELNWVRTRGFEAFRLDGESRERLMALLELMLQEPMENPEATVRAVGENHAVAWRGDQVARYRALCESDGPLDELEHEALKLVTQGGPAPRRQLSIFDEPAAGSDLPEPPRAPRAASASPSASPAPSPQPGGRSGIKLTIEPLIRRTRKRPRKPEATSAPKTLALLLDATRIADISQQTSAVGELLGDVFREEDGATAAQGLPAATVSPAVSLPPAPGAAAVPAWRRALALTVTRERWSADELFARWADEGLMAQAMADELNERALDACDELLLEGDAVFDVNPLAAQALAA